eukprot:1158905-Pelagomonas_calceolata.AAC.3
MVQPHSSSAPAIRCGNIVPEIMNFPMIPGFLHDLMSFRRKSLCDLCTATLKAQHKHAAIVLLFTVSKTLWQQPI